MTTQIHLSTPSPRQLAWQKMERYAFIHFGPNTFTDREWGEGVEDPKVFNPTNLDCRQWVRTFKAAGFKGVVLTAKHHDGFCLWPSKYSTHTVRESAWKSGQGDVLRELSEACKEAHLKLGIYLSPWDRNHPTYGTPEYNQTFANMLREVLGNYGPIFEVWFDGANGEGPNGKRQVYDWPLFIGVVRKLQPRAVIFSDAGPDIRWVGNEGGIAGETNWSTIDATGTSPGHADSSVLNAGTENGPSWIPAECDVSIRPGWFYHASEDAKVKSPEELERIYLASVGRNGSLILNVPPDRTGQINAHDVAALMGFNERLKKAFRTDLARKAHVHGSTVEFDQPVSFNRVILREEIAQGQRVKRFRVLADGKEIAVGTTIGNKRILVFPKVEAKQVEVQIVDSLAPAKLLPMALYLAE